MSDNDSSSKHPQAPGDDKSAGKPQRAQENPWDDPVERGLISEAERSAIWQTLIDNPPKPPNPQPLRPSQRRYETDFSKIVGPKLLKLIIGYAPLVQLDVYSYSDAWTAVWRAATHYGANHLAPETQAQLSDWIDCELLARIDDPLPDGLVTPERLRRITRSPLGED